MLLSNVTDKYDRIVLAKREESKGVFGGARKAAALLSLVDTKTADALLAQFEPEVVEEIVREAKKIKDAPREEFEAVLSEFLKATEDDGQNAYVARPSTNKSRASNGLTPEVVARLLRNESPFVGAIVLANMPSQDRLRTLGVLPQEQAEGIRRSTSVWIGATPVSKELEQEFTRRALQNERQ